mgnify:CR=1 FL=1
MRRYSGPVTTPRFAAALNAQIGNEFAAHLQYVAIAVHFDALTMPQMASFFYVHAREERDHAMMMVRYLLDTEAEVTIPGSEAPITRFDGVVEPINRKSVVRSSDLTLFPYTTLFRDRKSVV